MFKKGSKKIAAMICAAALVAQVGTAFPITAGAVNLESVIMIDQKEVAGANGVYTASTDEVVTKATAVVPPSIGNYVFDFNMTVNTLLKPDSSDGRGRTSFYIELAGSDTTKAGGVFHAKENVGNNAVRFQWKWTSAQTLNYDFLVGTTYNIKMIVTTANTITLVVSDTEGNQLFKAEGLNMRAATAHGATATTVGNFIVATSGNGGSETSVSIENTKLYGVGPDNITATLDGKEYSTTEQNTIDLDYSKTQEIKLDAYTKYEGVKTPEYTVTTALQMADGSKLPEGLSLTNGKIVSDLLLEGGTYATKLVVTLDADKTVKVEYPITFVKPQADDQFLINVYEPAIKNKGGATAADLTKIKDDILLDAGNQKISVEWTSSNEAVIDPKSGTVTPATEDTAVKLTAKIGSVALPTYINPTEEQQKEIDAGTAVLGKVVEFDATVLGVQQYVDAAIADGIVFKSNDDAEIVDLSKLIEDVVLSTTYTGSEYVKINWKSNSDVLKISKDNVAEIYPIKATAYDIKLTATAAYVKNGKTLATATKQYPVTVHLTKSNAAAKYAVRCDAIAPANFDALNDIIDNDNGKISSSFTLKTEGIFGSRIQWASSQPSYVSNSGKYTAPSSEKSLTMTATISKDKVSDTVKFSGLTIAKKKSSGSSGSSGSSSGSGTTFTGNPNPNTVPTPTPTQTPDASGFTDLDQVAWAQEAINELNKRGIISGKTQTTFAPNDEITRAEFAKIVVGAFGLLDTNAVVTALSDVQESDWYYKSVASAYNKGIITGYADGSFGVNDKITRQDMAVIIYRAAQAAGKTINEVNAAVTFADDASIESYAKEAVTVLQKGGIINGVSETEFAPTATATRAQAAKMIYSAIK